MKIHPLKIILLAAILPFMVFSLPAFHLFGLSDWRTITGTVRMPDGSPATNVQVQVIFGDGAKAKTDAQGQFHLNLPVQSGAGQEARFLLTRDMARNLAAMQDLDEDNNVYDLKLAPAMTLAGRVECDGKLLTNQVSVQVVFWIGIGSRGISGLARTNVPGQYEVPALPLGRRYSLDISVRGYGRESRDLGILDEPGQRELDPVEFHPANLKVAGQVLDENEKPVADCGVSISDAGQNYGGLRTDHEGRFVFEQVCAGEVRISANRQEAYGQVITEGGDTNVVLQLKHYDTSTPTPSSPRADAKTRKLQGTVLDTSGQPVVGAQVAVFPTKSDGVRWFKTDTNGSYHLTWSQPSWQQESTVWIIARDFTRGLAAKEEWLAEVTNLNVTLQPALTLAGQVKDAAGVPLPSARMRLWIEMGNSFQFLDENNPEKPVDSEGRFEIKNLPPEAQYMLTAMAKGHGSRQQNLNPNDETNRLELETFVLNPANQIIAGRVLDADDNPVSGADVRIMGGNGQPEGNLSTDRQGRFSFKVCQGQVPLYASSQNGGFAYAQATAAAGDTNIVINLRPLSGSQPAPVRQVTLKGKPLPDLTSVHLTAADVPAGQPVVLCLFDANQRPSRHALQVLNQQAAALQAKHVTVLAVQVSVLSDTAFNEWKTASGVTFPVGRVTETTDKTKWATRINALPWLVLADAKHVVMAEGFSLDDLPAQLDKLAK